MAKNTSSSKGNTRHVVPHPDGWANKKGGAERASSVSRFINTDQI